MEPKSPQSHKMVTALALLCGNAYGCRMATNENREVARVIRAEIEYRDTNIQALATAAGVKPRTFREHLNVGALTLDEVFAAAAALGMDASEILRKAEDRTRDRTAA